MKKILVSTQNDKCWVAVLKNNRLIDLFVEDQREKSIVGNIYKVRADRDIANKKFAEIGNGQRVFVSLEEDIEERLKDEIGLVGKILKKIEKIFSPKEEKTVFVQVVRDPEGRKSARASCQLTLSNREFVYLPLGPAIARVSHRITQPETRLKLSHWIKKFQVENKIKGGFVARTLAREVTNDALINSAKSLVYLWRDIENRTKHISAPGLIYKSPDYILQLIRDKIETGDLLLVDDRTRHQQLKELSEQVFNKPLLSGGIEIKFEPALWKTERLEQLIQKLLERRVSLPGGGLLVIEETEALTTVDVNSGRFAPQGEIEEIAFQTNLDACPEIARQVRLRSIGGIIVIDFINMKIREHCQKVETALQEAFQDDRERLEFTHISKLGLLELSRQRVRPSLRKLLGKTCSECGGKGLVFNIK